MNNNLKEIADTLCYPLYRFRGRPPWSVGYFTAKKAAILNAIKKGMCCPGGILPKGYGFGIDERVVEYPWVISRIPDNKNQEILDAGSALNWDYLLALNKIKESKLTICTLAPEKRCYWKQSVSYIYDDLRDMKFKDKSFDVVISISTIEHIGLDNTILYTSDESKCENKKDDYQKAVLEFRRVLKKGGCCFITVPFGLKENHGWFQVFNDKMISHIIDVFQPKSHLVEYYGYERSGWKNSKPEYLKHARYCDVNNKTDKTAPDKAAGARGVACIQMWR